MSVDEKIENKVFSAKQKGNYSRIIAIESIKLSTKVTCFEHLSLFSATVKSLSNKF